jgi:hypothetical protein
MKPFKPDQRLRSVSQSHSGALLPFKTKILSAKKNGAWMQAPNRGLTERSGEAFLLDILSHRMSEMG